MNRGDCAGNTQFLIGAGIHDITGPAAEREMIGYVMFTPPQTTRGIHMRLRSRAFVIASPCNGKRIVFVSADLGMVFQAVKQEVVRRLQAGFGDLYTADNVILSATHTHSGPGGYSHFFLYNAISLGFDEQNFEAIVGGIVHSIVKAHNNLAPGTIRIAWDDLPDTSWNRSPKAYEKNLDKAQHGHDVDRRMTVLRLTASDGQEIGTINWFAVHGTSLSNRNRLISGDNKGYASYLFEKAAGADYQASKTFVAAFAQSNEGDVTPNHQGHDQGPKDPFDRLKESATRQYEKARRLYDGASDPIAGGVEFGHVNVDFASVQVDAKWTDGLGAQRTCASAIGVSKLAGTEDGRGLPFVKEGLSERNISLIGKIALKLWLTIWLTLLKLWRVLSPGRRARARRWLSKGMARLPRTEDCQEGKPVFLPVGRMQPPWTPQVLPVQLVTIGQLAVVALPFECTTMAGRRIRTVVENELKDAGLGRCVIAGLSNAYGGYVTTREEYLEQHYEGASTEFGPWQLAAIQQIVSQLAVSLRDGQPMAGEPEPTVSVSGNFGLQIGSRRDIAPPRRKFGDVHKNAARSYEQGKSVKVAFWGGHPGNNLQTQSSFLEVQLEDGDSWRAVARDWDPETRFVWKRWLFVSPISQSVVEWDIPDDQEPGTYRVVHHGHSGSRSGTITPYTGTSRAFTVRARGG